MNDLVKQNWGLRSTATYSQMHAHREALIARSVRKVVLFVFFFTTFSGSLRKWVIDSGAVSNVILAVQLLIPFSFVWLLKYKEMRSPFNSLLTIYTGILILMAINPMNLTIFHGLFGIMLHLGFWFAIFFYLQNWQYFPFKGMIKIFVIVGIIEIVLGMVQSTLPPGHFLNKYATDENSSSVALIGGSTVRVTGTFSYLAGYGSFCIFFPLMLWGALRLKLLNSTSLLFLYAGGLVACFMNGSRTAFYPYVLTGALIVYIEFGVKRLFNVLVAGGLMVGLIAAMVFFLGSKVGFLSNTVTAAYKNFDNRRTVNQERGEEKGRLLNSVRDVIFFPGEYPLIGVGLGATYQGAVAVWGTSKYVQEYPSFLEEEPERIVVEGGFVLLFLKIVLFIALFRALAIPVAAKLPLLILAFLFFSLVFFTYSSTYFFLGLMILDRSYRNKAVGVKTMPV